MDAHEPCSGQRIQVPGGGNPSTLKVPLYRQLLATLLPINIKKIKIEKTTTTRKTIEKLFMKFNLDAVDIKFKTRLKRPTARPCIRHRVVEAEGQQLFGSGIYEEIYSSSVWTSQNSSGTQHSNSGLGARCIPNIPASEDKKYVWLQNAGEESGRKSAMQHWLTGGKTWPLLRETMKYQICSERAFPENMDT
uniref:Uncharacterized protein n=1 Tax=Romanomermis culicivorax TaxID=13658 RepID=A0A915JPK9_ROMCU